MGHVEVAAGYHGLLGSKAAEKITVRRVPRQARVNARQLVLRVGRVDVHKPVGGKLESTDAALVVGRGRTDMVNHLQRLLATEHSSTGVALALGVAPALVVAGQLQADLPLLELGFLNGKDIRTRGFYHVHKAWVLLHHGAKPVYVPGNKAQLAGVGHDVPFSLPAHASVSESPRPSRLAWVCVPKIEAVARTSRQMFPKVKLWHK